MYSIALILHLLAACVWTGGHLVLATVILPKVLKHRDVERLLWFESAYEKIGIPALIIQVSSGIYLAQFRYPDISRWLSFDADIKLLSIKLLLLASTALFAVDARLRIIPNLSAEKLNSLAWHIVPVTVVSVAFVLAGAGFRLGW